jgi:hypothetical protein
MGSCSFRGRLGGRGRVSCGTGSERMKIPTLKGEGTTFFLATSPPIVGGGVGA